MDAQSCTLHRLFSSAFFHRQQTSTTVPIVPPLHTRSASSIEMNSQTILAITLLLFALEVVGGDDVPIYQDYEQCFLSRRLRRISSVPRPQPGDSVLPNGRRRYTHRPPSYWVDSVRILWFSNPGVPDSGHKDPFCPGSCKCRRRYDSL